MLFSSALIFLFFVISSKFRLIMHDTTNNFAKELETSSRLTPYALCMQYVTYYMYIMFTFLKLKVEARCFTFLFKNQHFMYMTLTHSQFILLSPTIPYLHLLNLNACVNWILYLMQRSSTCLVRQGLVYY